MSQNQRIAERYAESMGARDLDATYELLHADVVVRYPQSGEVFRGADTYISMLRQYPTLPDAEVSANRGEKDQVLVGAHFPLGMPVVTLIGGGDTFILEGLAEYADSGIFNVIAILKMRDGRVGEETWYWAPAFEPPEWRKAASEG